MLGQCMGKIVVPLQEAASTAGNDRMTYDGQFLSALHVTLRQIPEPTSSATKREDQRKKRAEEDYVGSESANSKDSGEHS